MTTITTMKFRLHEYLFIRIIQRRNFVATCQLNNTVRLRFAPSPTGYLHLGGLRTLIFNYIFAKQNNGKLILRIEDTDRKRLVQDAAQSLQESIEWSGITFDESPSIEGNFGPYVQSQRLDLYKKEAEHLIKNGGAYKCFCSSDRLMLLRNEALKNRENLMYDKKCRNLSETEVEEKIKSGERYTVRLKVDNKATANFTDLVYGDLEHSFSDTDDAILMKSDGYPIYHFANVVDDRNMQISHVIRGVEWLSSLPLHLYIYKTFGWTPPVFAHLPLLKKGSTKLSKRSNAAFVNHYREKGYFPLALINSVCSVGGGFKNRDKHKLYELNELVDLFDVTAIKTHDVQFEPDWLNYYNAKVLANVDSKSLVPYVKKIVLEKFGENLKNIPECLNVLEDAYVERIISYARDRISTANDLIHKDMVCFWSVPDEHFFVLNELLSKTGEYSLDMLSEVVDLLNEKSEFFETNFDRIVLAEKLSALAAEKSWPTWRLFTLLRAAFNGGVAGPPVAEIMELLGYSLVKNRLKYALDSVKTVGKEQSVKV